MFFCCLIPGLFFPFRFWNWEGPRDFLFDENGQEPPYHLTSPKIQDTEMTLRLPHGLNPHAIQVNCSLINKGDCYNRHAANPEEKNKVSHNQTTFINKKKITLTSKDMIHAVCSVPISLHDTVRLLCEEWKSTYLQRVWRMLCNSHHSQRCCRIQGTRD